MGAGTIKLFSILTFVLLGPFVGGLLQGLDRKLTARLEGRVGPPILQPFYDVSKLFGKDKVVVNNLQNFFIIGYLVFIVFTGGLFFAGGDILLVLFALTLAEIYLIMASCSSNSPYATMGAQRELIQMVSYEPMLLLVAIGFYKATGSFSVEDILISNEPLLRYLPGMFVGFLFILTIKFRKSPFDFSTSHHAHQEMVKGTTVEFSGRVLGITEIAHWYETILLLGVVILFFGASSLSSLVIGIIACFIAYFFEIIIDITCARMKWLYMLQITWLVAVVLGMTNLLILNYLI